VIILSNDPAVSRIVSTRESTGDAPHFENVSRVSIQAEQSADERHPAARGHDDGTVTEIVHEWIAPWNRVRST
jgi:hypothetical protein